MKSSYSNQLNILVVNWLQKFICDNEIDYITLADSLISAIKIVHKYLPQTKQVKVNFSDGYKNFEISCTFEDNGETLSGVTITAI